MKRAIEGFKKEYLEKICDKIIEKSQKTPSGLLLVNNVSIRRQRTVSRRSSWHSASFLGASMFRSMPKNAYLVVFYDFLQYLQACAGTVTQISP